MLIRFRVSNFRSIREEQEFSLVAAPLKDNPKAVIHVKDGLNLLTCAAIYGANASGKTNVLKAWKFLVDAITDSQSSWKPDFDIPRQPFQVAITKPTLLEADILLHGIRYQYGFIADSTQFREEWLFAYPQGRKQKWFKRKGQKFEFGKKLRGGKSISVFTRTNSLFLSTAAQYNHPLLTPVYNWFSELTFSVHDRSMLREVIQLSMTADVGLRTLLEGFLTNADFGISKMQPADKRKSEATQELIVKLLQQEEDVNVKQAVLKNLPDILLSHGARRKGTFMLPLSEESNGTQVYFALLGPLLLTLREGGVIFLDELDASLHPLLSLQIIRLFNDSSTNPRRAQLVFTTHDTTLLRESNLRRDQIWFTEKDSGGATHLYPLTDFRPRAHENLEKGYLQGRYGAVPVLGDFAALLKEAQ